MARRTQPAYSEELKTQVIAAWKAGSSWSQLAFQFGVPKSTMRDWVKGHDRTVSAPKKTETGRGAEAEGAEKRDAETIDDIAWAHVKAAGAATTAILGKAADPDWLDRQDANALAILYGVIADKEFRLLAAFRGREDDDDAAAGAEQPQLPERAGEAP